MSNPYFRFKQFTIIHDRCAMKVTTDSCLFGAWCAVGSHQLAVGKEFLNMKHAVLDIGTGSGLLSLMYVQQNPTVDIDAVELDEHAAAQATENVGASPWPSSVTVVHQNIKDFEPGYLFDVIISNPPFYEQQLQSNDAKKNSAHHSSQLSLEALFETVNRLLKTDGHFFILLPGYRTDEVIAIAGMFSLFPAKKVMVKQTPQHGYFRTMILFGRQNEAAITEQEIVIETERGKYSDAFITLLKDYYLHL
ncbi:MAG: methyltransferase [Bacteroidota bacterium]